MADFSQKSLTKPPLKLTLLALLVVVGSLTGLSEVYAGSGSCAYQEAIMAMEKGNEVRGLALMRIASRDGDHRAQSYLREQDYMTELPVLVKARQPLSLAGISRH